MSFILSTLINYYVCSLLPLDWGWVIKSRHRPSPCVIKGRVNKSDLFISFQLSFLCLYVALRLLIIIKKTKRFCFLDEHPNYKMYLLYSTGCRSNTNHTAHGRQTDNQMEGNQVQAKQPRDIRNWLDELSIYIQQFGKWKAIHSVTLFEPYCNWCLVQTTALHYLW